MKKRSLIFFEILIALSLTAILLTFLFSFFVESAKIEKKLDTARLAITSRAFLQTRLQSVLGAISHDACDAPLYTKRFEKEEHMSLVAVFDNGIDPDPAFSGAILGRLFLDAEHNLTLATWPLDNTTNHSWRKESLFPHVKSFAFEFIGQNNAGVHEEKEITRPINATLAWRTHWSPSQGQVPSIIRLNLQEEKMEEPLHFAFILPRPVAIVTYQRDKL